MNVSRRKIECKDSFNCIRELQIDNKTYHYFDLKIAEENGLKGLSTLPHATKILIENLLRHEDGVGVTKDIIIATIDDMMQGVGSQEIRFLPARVLMQDFTGVPAVVDLAAMRDAMQKKGYNAQKVNPMIPVDLVIDHSLMVDFYAQSDAFEKNTAIEYKRNKERYTFLRWGADAFNNLRVVPPGVGICHQVNLEYLSRVVWQDEVTLNGKDVCLVYPDTLIGTDSHTTMVNGLAVLGWGVGGIEAEAAMLGQPLSMLVPKVVGFELKGALAEGVTATDLVLRVTEMLRQKGVVGKFVEFFGEGVANLGLEDRATIGNMAPEYGATCGFFSVDDTCIAYLKNTGRDGALCQLVEEYSRAVGLSTLSEEKRIFTDMVTLDLADVTASLAGPKRPQDRIVLHDVPSKFADSLVKEFNVKQPSTSIAVSNKEYSINNGSVVIAAITSCTNTSNPNVMIAAGLLAQKAHEKGLSPQPWVKTSLAPGSQVVSDYLKASGLQTALDMMGFNVVGYGCTTCIGNSGPLDDDIVEAIRQGDLVAAAVLSGNRNFEGRINPHVRANFLASPPLVVAYAIAGRIDIDFQTTPLGMDAHNNPVYLRDIWPRNEDIQRTKAQAFSPNMYADSYARSIQGDEKWKAIETENSVTYPWSDVSTYIRKSPFLELPHKPYDDIIDARIIATFGDSITTDHISPAGAIKSESPAGEYLKSFQISHKEFNSYGARRGNHNVMLRGTFANIRLKNKIVEGKEGGYTMIYPENKEVSIFEAAEHYGKDDIPLVVFAAKEYGTGSSRDWAAKGTRLLGIRAVIAESFERIHRTNLVGMGVVPFVFDEGWTLEKAAIQGSEIISINGMANIQPGMKMHVGVQYANGTRKEIPIICRIDTIDELKYYKAGGILPYVLDGIAQAQQ